MTKTLTEDEFMNILRWQMAMLDVPRFSRHIQMAEQMRTGEGQRGHYRCDQKTGRFIFVHDTAKAIHAN